MDPNQPNRPTFQPPTSAMINALSLGRKVLLGSSLLLLIAYFLPWYSWEVNFFGVENSDSANGLRGLPALGFLILLVLIAAAAGPLFGQRIKNFVQTALTEGTLLFYGAIAVAVLVIVGGFLASPSDADLGGMGDAGLAIGYFIALLASLGAVAGGWLMKQAGE